MDRPAPSRLAFIDFEASGLGAKTWPIEVGWAFEDGVGESFLISPAPEWSMDEWDPRAERLHGISPKMLSDLGVNASLACDRLTKALNGFEVYSDAPDWDGFWLMRLFDVAGRKSAIRLRDFTLLMPSMSVGQKSLLLARADREAPRRHRAAEDALHLAALHRLASGFGGGPSAQ
ncbi:MAG: hypothetical protein A3E78_05580 [Alphaproteobacteria bacterium RIFCSPHIGHO2_12_FULL_63_12]|nr:MAG: hypothetical protein A3E78_05580 [Alphaproteobacteria bacterium RIFCSPHIGHO2_12_FULL_63_12]